MQREFGISKKFSSVLFDSRNTNFKQPFGAVATRQKVNIIFPVIQSLNTDSVKMFLRRNSHISEYRLQKIGEQNGYDIFGVEFFVIRAGTYFYRFEIYAGGNTLYCGKGKGGEAIVGEWLPEWQLSVYQSSYTTADFIKGGVVYQIFADRFCASGHAPKPRFGTQKQWNEDVNICDENGNYYADDFYGGDFDGIISKLDYLKDLGVTCIYLTPIFESVSNHRYDTGDYTKIDEMLGGEEAFERFLRACDKKDIAVVLDGVFNHTGADSIYFNKFGHYGKGGAYQTKNSPYYDWYTFYDYPEQYNCWWGCTNVPTVTREAHGYQNMIAGEGGVIEKRLKQGVKGWRLDVVDELSESFVKKIRDRIKKTNQDALILGEVWEDASTKCSYGEEREYFFGEDLDGVMNYVFKDAIDEFILSGNAENFVNEVLSIEENYPLDSLNTCFTLLDSHDTMRAINTYAGVDLFGMSTEYKKAYRLSETEYAKGKQGLKLASCLQFFLPGAPCIYYGDEVGLQGFKDPLNRRPYPWGKEDKELLSHYCMLGNLRKKHRKDFIAREEIFTVKDTVVIRRGEIELSVNAKDRSFLIVTPNGGISG